MCRKGPLFQGLKQLSNLILTSVNISREFGIIREFSSLVLVILFLSILPFPPFFFLLKTPPHWPPLSWPVLATDARDCKA